MYPIIGKQNLTATVRRFDIKVEALVARLKPGHFVTLMLDAASRPVAYNIVEIDWRRKCFSIIADSPRMDALKINDEVYAVGGPFGAPIPLEKKGTIICMGEELAVGSLLNLARALKQAGNKVIGIAGFETRKMSLFESQLRLNCNRSYVMHKDGMHERKGSVLAPLKKVLSEEPVARIYADASPEILAAARVMAAEKGVPVSVNLMGMINACGAFDENDFIILGGRRYFPAVEGVVVDAQGFDLKEAVRVIASQTEYMECRKKEQGSLRQCGVWARLKKLFWA